jgi:RimJ/RimL family protein N-acetyltransferase
MKEIRLNNCILRQWNNGDEESLVYHANNRKIWDNVDDLFPYPYTMEHAVQWVEKCRHENPPKNFAIIVDGNAVGGIGIVIKEGIRRKTAEIGYWLGEKFWNKGIVTEAVKAVTEYSFSQFDICRVQATVFPDNIASQRVLEKAGYVLEARLKCAIIKNEVIMDEMIFSITRQFSK